MIAEVVSSSGARAVAHEKNTCMRKYAKRVARGTWRSLADGVCSLLSVHAPIAAEVL